MADPKFLELLRSGNVEKTRGYLDSIKNSYLSQFKSYLGYYTNPANDPISGGSPLSIALDAGNPEMVKLLIEYGANIDDKEEKLIKDRVRLECSYNRTDKGPEQVLEWLKLMKSSSFVIFEPMIVEYLYSKSNNLVDELVNLPNFQLQEEDKKALAELLSKQSQASDFDRLIDLGADPTLKFNEENVFNILIKQKKFELVRYLVGKDFKIPTEDKALLSASIAKLIKENTEGFKDKYIDNLNEIKNIKTLLQLDFNETDLEIIKEVFNSKHGSLEILENLLSLDSKVVDVVDMSEIIKDYSNNKHSRIRVREFLDKFNLADKYSQELIELYNADAKDLIEHTSFDIKAFKECIENGVDVNIKNSEGNTALTKNIMARDFDKVFIDFLLEKGAKIHEPNNQGKSALTYLLERGEFYWVKELFGSSKSWIKDLFESNKSYGNSDPIYLENAIERFPGLFKKITHDPEFITVLDGLGISIDLSVKQNGETLLTQAIKDRNNKLIKALTRKKIAINVKDMLTIQAREFPSKPYINFAHSILTINDLANDDLLKQYKEMKLDSLYFQVDQLNLDYKFANFIEQATKAGIQEIIIFCNKDKSQLSQQELLEFLKENKVRINLNIAPVTNDDLVAVEKDKFAQGNLLGCENIKLEEDDYSLLYNNKHKIQLLNNKECDKVILENFLDNRKKLIDPSLNDLYEAKYISADNSSKANRISRNIDKSQVNLEFSVSVSSEVSNKLEVKLDKEMSIDIDAEQAGKKYNKKEVFEVVKKLFSNVFSEEDLVTSSVDYFAQLGSPIPFCWRIFDSSKNIHFITEQALLRVLELKMYIPGGIDLDNLPEGLAFKDNVIFASKIRPSNMPINDFTIKKNYIAPSIDGPFKSWLQYASKENLTPSQYYKSELKEGKEIKEDFYKNNLGFPKNLQRLRGTFDRRQFSSSNSMVQEHIFPSRNVLDEEYLGLNFIMLTEVERKKINQIYEEFDKRGLKTAFDLIINSHPIKRGDFLLKEETLVFFDRLFTKVLPLDDPKKIKFFSLILGDKNKTYDREGYLYLEDMFLGLDYMYEKTQEFIKKQEIAIEHHDSIYKAIISSLSNIGKGAYANKLNKIYNVMEATAINGGNLHELLYYNEQPFDWVYQPNLKEQLEKYKLNTIVHSIDFATKEELLLSLTESNRGKFSLHENEPIEAIKDSFDNKVSTYLSMIPPHQRVSVDNYKNFIASTDSKDFKKGKIPSNIGGDGNEETRRILDDKFPRPSGWYDLSIDNKKEYLEKKNPEHLRLLNQEIKEYYDLHRDETFSIKTKGLASENGECNLIENFSSNQAQNNLKLLTLNIITSSGNYYDLTYPDQEFSSYLSLFSTLFEKVKINEPFQVAKVDEKYGSIKYMERLPSVNFDKGGYIEEEIPDNVKEKNQLHEKMLDEFIQIHSQNQEFNFAQLTALGLVANLIPEEKDRTIAAAKELSQYGQQFSQLLRVSLATSVTDKQDLSELTKRTNTIMRNINFLNQEINGVKIHQQLTKNGDNPENLAFFALCFSKEKNLKPEDILSLIDHVDKLDKNLKWQLLEKVGNSKIPFESGKIIDNHFPTLSIEDLQYPSKLKNIINDNVAPKINYEFKKRFNDISLDSRQNAPINFQELKTSHPERIDLGSLKNLNYKELKQKITSDVNFIIKLINKPYDSDRDFIASFSREFLQGILANIAQRTKTFEIEAKKTIDLLYDSKRSLSEQFYDFEASYQLLEKIAKKLPSTADKLLLIEKFVEEPRIPQEKMHELLKFLNSLDNDKLAAKNYNILSLVQEVENQVLDKQFKAFRISVDLFLNSEKQVDFKQLTRSLIALNKKQYVDEQTVKILSYCIENQDFTVVNLFQSISGKDKKIGKIVDFVTSLTPQEINQIDSHISLKKLIHLKPLDKASLVIKVIQKYDNELNSEQYNLIYDSVVNKNKYTKDHHQKLLSYLLNPGSNISNEETIKIVFENYNKIDNLKDIFKKINDRFTNFNPERFGRKIAEITNLNADNYGSLEKQKAELLLKSGEKIYDLAKEYSALSLAEISLKSQELQHKRMLMKENTVKEKLEMDLEFIALSCQAMYLSIGKFPKDTQILAMLNSIVNEGNIAQQISTGQGKGIIVALHAAYMSYLGQTTIVTTSSQELASRDLEEFAPFYQGMNLKSGSEIILANSDSVYENRGIYYSTSPDIALNLAQMKFNKKPGYEKLLSDLSIISDEVDGKLTSEINYILGVPLVNAEQDQAQSLFKHILEFSKSDIFLNSQVSRDNDVHNLIESIKLRFSQFDRSLNYPINSFQLKKLEASDSLEAKEIVNINNILVELEKGAGFFVLANLLEGAVQSKSLKENVDYILSESEDRFGEKLLNAVPISQTGILAKGTRFGNAQPFLNLKIKEEHPKSKLKPDCTFPSSIIYDLTAKNLLDYIRLAKGRIIGFTGTLGDPGQLEEFSRILAINSFTIPDFEDSKRVIKTYEVENKEEQYLAFKDDLDKNQTDRPILIFCETNDEAIKLHTMLKNEGKQNLQLGDISLTEEEMKEIIRKAGERNYITILTKGSCRGVNFITDHIDGFYAYNLCTENTINERLQTDGRIARQGTNGFMISFLNKDQYRSFDSYDQFMRYLSKKQTLEREKKRFVADVNQYFNEVNAGNRDQAIKAHDFIDRTWKMILANNNVLAGEERKTLAQLHNQLLSAVNEEYPGDSRDLKEYLMKLKECLPGENTICHLEAKLTIDVANQESRSTEYIITPEDLTTFPNLETIEANARSIHISKMQPPGEGDSPVYQAYYGTVKDMQAAIINAHTFVIGPEERKFNITYNYNDTLPQYSAIYHMVSGEGSNKDLMLDELVKSIDAYRDHAHNSQEIDKIAEVIANMRNAGDIDFNLLDTKKTQAIVISIIAKEAVESALGHVESILIDNNLLYLVNRGGGSDTKPGIKIYQLIDDHEKIKEGLSKLKTKATVGNLESDIIGPIVKNDRDGQPFYHYIPMPAQIIGNCGWAQLESQIKTIAIAGRLHEAIDHVDFKKLPNMAEYQSSLKKAEDIYKDFTLFDQIRRIETEIYTRDADFKPKYLDKLTSNQIDKQRKLWRKPISDELFSATIKTFDENLTIFQGSIYENYAEEMSQRAHVELLSTSSIGEALTRSGITNVKELLVKLDLESLKNLENIYSNIIKENIDGQLNQDQVLIKILKYINANPEEESVFLSKLQEVFDEDRLKLEGKDYVIRDNLKNAGNEQNYMLFSVLEDFVDKKDMQLPQQIEFTKNTQDFVKPYDPKYFDFYSHNFIDQIPQNNFASQDEAKDNIYIKIPDITADGIIHQIQFAQTICNIAKNVAYSLYCNFYVPNFSPEATKEELSKAKKILENSSNMIKEYEQTYDVLNNLYQTKIWQHNEKPDDKLRDEISILENIKNEYYENKEEFKNLCINFIALKKEKITIKKTNVEMLESQYNKFNKIHQEIQENFISQEINQLSEMSKEDFRRSKYSAINLPRIDPVITETQYISNEKASYLPMKSTAKEIPQLKK